MSEGPIGAILASSLPDANEAWTPESVRGRLEHLNCRAIERGMSTAKYNSRGVVSKSIAAGGVPEHSLKAFLGSRLIERPYARIARFNDFVPSVCPVHTRASPQLPFRRQRCSLDPWRTSLTGGNTSGRSTSVC